MRFSGALVAACVTTCSLAALVAPDATAAVFLGMAAPLVVGIATIVMVEQTARTNPSAFTRRMILAFAVKMLFYAAYVTVTIGLLNAAPVPFMISFTVYFVGLQFTEALYFKTLFAQTGRNAPAAELSRSLPS